MNIVLDEAFEEKPGGEKVSIGMTVCSSLSSETKDFLHYKLLTVGPQVIRGNSVVLLEALERISDK